MQDDQRPKRAKENDTAQPDTTWNTTWTQHKMIQHNLTQLGNE